MPKILYLVTEDWFFASHFVPMARTAQRQGFDVVVATRLQAHAGRLAAEGFRLISLPSDRSSLRPDQAVRDLVRIYALIRQENPDIVHCIAMRPVVLGGIAAKCAKAKALVLAPTGLGRLWMEARPDFHVLRWLIRLVVGSWLRGPRARYLFENRDDPREFGLDPDAADITIVGGAGVDPDEFPFVAEPPSPPVRVATVSRMIAPKGIAEAVEAVTRARARGAPLELHLFGGPDPANRDSIPVSLLQDWAARPGIAWHGWTSDVARVWREHHIALALSHYREGLPRALVEAAACGRPIVTTDVTGCRELVGQGEQGFLVPPLDIEAAADALMELAGDPALRVRMGAAARFRFEERYTEKATTSAVGEVYRSLRNAAERMS
jgi:glycosyltransferase involved in cell wall biosynthesis